MQKRKKIHRTIKTDSRNTHICIMFDKQEYDYLCEDLCAQLSGKDLLLLKHWRTSQRVVHMLVSSD